MYLEPSASKTWRLFLKAVALGAYGPQPGVGAPKMLKDLVLAFSSPPARA
jgi:hypothetical protein